MAALSGSPQGCLFAKDISATHACVLSDTPSCKHNDSFPCAPASGSLRELLRDLARRPADVLAAPDVRGAEALVRDVAKTHGAWRLWTDEGQYVRWLTR